MRTVRALLALALFALAAAGLSIHALAACGFVPAAVLIERHFARED
jgi:hypothetical protein